ncbi:MAG TPA: NADPH-dependent 7-cyano-7-deazaguanine reductase QueF [Luteimonas sp.]
MNTGNPLGREVAYPRAFDPSLLFPIPRAQGRAALGLEGAALPFAGHDRWHAYELSWLDGRGRPMVETATFLVPADSPHLIESKSLKLYLNSLNGSRFDSRAEVLARIVADLSAAAGAPVTVAFGLPPVDAGNGAMPGAPEPVSLDLLEVECSAYDTPDPGLLATDGTGHADEVLHSNLLKSNCPVTGQPDWASVRIAYSGPRIDHEGLLRYLVSFREHAGFHEQCVEQVFTDILARCRPDALSVEARYTRRGGLDINPWRATPGLPAPAMARDPRQ